MIHDISIATDDDIIQFGNDINIYTVYLSRAIVIWGNCLNWLEKTIVSDHIFCQILVSWFGYSFNVGVCLIKAIRFSKAPLTGAQWLSGTVLGSRPRDRGFEPHQCHYVVSLSKNINPSLVPVQPSKICPIFNTHVHVYAMGATNMHLHIMLLFYLGCEDPSTDM